MTATSDIAPARPAALPPRNRTTLLAEAWTLVPLLLVAGAALEAAARSGAGHGALLRICGVVLVTQVIPGVLVWRSLRPRDGWLVGDLVFGAAVGAALAIPGTVLSVLLHTHLVAWLLAWVVAALVLAVPASRERVRAAQWQPLPWWWGAGVAAVGGLLFLVTSGLFRQTLPGKATWTTQYVDVPFHLGLIGDLEHRFPPHTPQVASEKLDYHWFAHAWMAQIGSTSGADLDVILLRFAPVFCAVAVAAAIALLAVRLTGSTAAGPLAAGATLFVGPISFATRWGFSYPVGAQSPSTSLAVFLGAPVVALLAFRWRGEVPGWTWPAVFLMAMAAGGSKGSFLPVLVLGVLFAAVAAWLGHHERRRRVLLDLGIVVVALVVLFEVLFAGRAGAMTTTPFDSLALSRGDAFAPMPPGGWGTGALVGLTVLMLSSLLLPYVAAFGTLAWRRSVGDPAFWMLVGIVAAGVGAVLVFTHPGQAQWYFRTMTLPYLAIAVVWGLWVLVARRHAIVAVGIGLVVGVLALGPLHPLLPGEGERTVRAGLEQLLTLAVLLLVVAVVSAMVLRRSRSPRSASLFVAFAVLLGGLVGAGLPGATMALTERGVIGAFLDGREVAVQPAGPRVNGSVAAGEVTAARYIADHAAADDLVMTNRHCRNLHTKVCDNRHFWLGALSEHRVLVEGWAYTTEINDGGHGDPTYRRNVAPFWDHALLDLNDGFYTDPTREKARQLYDKGVRWVYVDLRLEHSEKLGEVARKVYSDHVAAVYRLTPQRGTGS